MRIIELDQKTGRPVTEMAELADGFKLTLKKDVDPDAILGRAKKEPDVP